MWINDIYIYVIIYIYTYLTVTFEFRVLLMVHGFRLCFAQAELSTASTEAVPTPDMAHVIKEVSKLHGIACKFI